MVAAAPRAPPLTQIESAGTFLGTASVELRGAYGHDPHYGHLNSLKRNLCQAIRLCVPGHPPRSRVAAQGARVASPWGHPQTTGPPGGKHWPGVFLKMPRTGDHRARGPVVWAGDQYLSKDAAVCWLLDQWQPAPGLLPRPSDLVGIAPSKAAEAKPSCIREIIIIITIIIIA